MDLITEVLARVSPRAACRRLQWRAAFDMASRQYDAAKNGRRTAGWNRSKTSGATETASALVNLRAASRDLVRNNGLAEGALDTLVSELIGTGLRPRFEGVGKGVRSKLTSRWDRWSDEIDPEGLIDIYGLQALAVRTTMESGGGFIRWLPRDSNAGLELPLQAKVLEPDHIDHTMTREGSNGNVIIQGVEFDAHGRRVAYYMFPEHPGDRGPITSRRWKAERVPAEYIQPIFEIQRPGQIHGVPVFSPVIMAMNDVNDYRDAERMRKRMAACFVAIITNPDGEPPEIDTKQDAAGNRIEEMRPGMVRYTQPGEQVEFGEPGDSGDYGGYLNAEYHSIAAGIGLSYHQFTGDLSSANYSSLREGKLKMWSGADAYTTRVIRPMLCRPLWREFWRYASVIDNVRTEPKVVWSRPSRPWVDPKKDAEGESMNVRNGFKSLRQAIADRGLDPEAVLEDIADGFKQLDELGLVLDSDPRKSTKASNTSQNANQEDDNATGKDEDTDA